MSVEVCPICHKAFVVNPYTSAYSDPPSLKARLVMHMVTAHPKQVTVRIKRDPNDIEAWITDIEASKY